MMEFWINEIAIAAIAALAAVVVAAKACVRIFARGENENDA